MRERQKVLHTWSGNGEGQGSFDLRKTPTRRAGSVTPTQVTVKKCKVFIFISTCRKANWERCWDFISSQSEWPTSTKHLARTAGDLEEKHIPLFTLGGMQIIGQRLHTGAWRALRKLKMNPPQGWAIALGICPKDSTMLTVLYSQ